MQRKNNYLKYKSHDVSKCAAYAQRMALHQPSTGLHMLAHKSRCTCGGFCPVCHSQNLLQAKFRINSPNDKYEQEADRVADKVVASESQGNHMDKRCAPPASLITPVSLPTIQRQPDVEEDGGFAGADSETDESEMAYIMDAIAEHESALDEDEEIVQAKPKDETGVAYSARDGIGTLSSGKALPESSRAYFMQHMGVDFSPVRIHSDERAAEAAESINARAFTLGRDVVFNEGEYSPHTREGRHLLAHELTHVIQQSNSTTGHIQRQKMKTLPLWLRLIIEIMRFALGPLFWWLSPGKIANRKAPQTYSKKSTSFLKNTKLTNQFFSDLNGVIKGMSGKTSSLSLSNYQIKSPKDYVSNVSRSRFGSDYKASLKQATEACDASLYKQCGADKSCLRAVSEYQKTSSGFCVGNKPTMDGIANFVISRGYTRVRYNRIMGNSVVIRENETDALLHLLVHEGIHRLSGKSWRVRCNQPVGSQYKHSVKGVPLKMLSVNTDEGATQLLTLEVIKKMQAIKGRNWFKGFKPTAYATQVKYVQQILSNNKKNIDFLTKAYFSDASYKKIEDIQLWQ